MIYVGLVLFYLGGAAMDSESLLIPMLMVFTGLAMMMWEGRKYEQ